MFVPRIEIHEGADAEIIFPSAQLRVADDLRGDKIWEAIIHEIVEIINESHELKLPHHKIMTLGAAIHQVMVDNKLDPVREGEPLEN